VWLRAPISFEEVAQTEGDRDLDRRRRVGRRAVRQGDDDVGDDEGLGAEHQERVLDAVDEHLPAAKCQQAPGQRDDLRRRNAVVRVAELLGGVCRNGRDGGETERERDREGEAQHGTSAAPGRGRDGADHRLRNRSRA
jgi:hypothetical protein